MRTRQIKFRRQLKERFFGYLYGRKDDSEASYRIAMDVELLLISLNNAYSEVQRMLEKNKPYKEILDEIRNFKENQFIKRKIEDDL